MNEKQFLSREIDLVLSGYQRGAFEPEVYQNDRRVAEGMRCGCGGGMRYKPYYRPPETYSTRGGNYIAFAVCRRCGSAKEF